MTLYQEVYPEKQLHDPAIQKRFLERLRRLIPTCVDVTIVTDAGFLCDWFSAVEQMGWKWIKRLRHNKLFFQEKGSLSWVRVSDLQKKATNKAVFYAEVMLSKKKQKEANIYLYQGLPKGRKSLTKCKKERQDTKAMVHRKSAKEAFIIASNIKHEKNMATKIIRLYQTRMQIEEAFRDMKDPYTGLGFNYCRTKEQKRLEVLLLIGTIALLFLWLIGWAAEKKGLQREFQANTIRKHRVLSLTFLGRQIILHKIREILWEDLINALLDLQSINWLNHGLL